jgi:chromosome segregation ATPase
MKSFKKHMATGLASVWIASSFMTSAYAGETGTDANGTVQTEATASQQATVKLAGITPDNWLYGFERIGERIRLTFTLSSEAEAVLFTQLANERLAEAQVMDAKELYDLVEDMLKDYSRSIANAKGEIESATQDEEIAETVQQVIVEVDELESTSSILLQELIKNLSPEAQIALTAALLKEQVKTKAVVEFHDAKKSFIEANKSLKVARKNLKEAKASGNAEAIAQAEAQVLMAQSLKEEMEKLKDAAETKKESIKKQLEEAEENLEELEELIEELEEAIDEADEENEEADLQEEADKDEEQDEAQSSSKAVEALEKAKEKVEKKNAIAAKAIEKAQEKANKRQEKAREKANQKKHGKDRDNENDDNEDDEEEEEDDEDEE